jgi:hypothetical protein
MTPIVERVRKLIALTASPNEHEARAAAFLACRLIRENALDISEPGLSTGRRAEARSSGRRAERPAPPERPRERQTRGPYARARGLRGEPRCSECAEPIGEDDACLDADGQPVHGDCIPGGERP